MAEIKFKTEWLTAIGLAAKCGTPEEVMDICIAIQRASLGEEVGELTPLVELLFNPVAEDINEIRTKSERNRTNRKGKRNENERPFDKEKEEREEEREAERETEKENFPHTPLKEKDKEKGEEGEEAKEEREIISRPLRAEVCEIALPEPQFIAETDPKKLTERMLEEEFDALWLLYPRKDGRKDALRHYKAARREGVTFDEVESGIKRYANYVRDKDPTYTAMGSTWFCGHRWEDRIENHGPRPGSMAWLANIANGGALDDS